MPAKHVALLLTTGVFLIIGLGIGFADAEVEVDSQNVLGKRSACLRD